MISVGVVGGTGYTGIELLRLLLNHPRVSVDVITSRTEEGVAVADIYHNLRGHCDLIFSAPDVDNLAACDIVFFATPHGVAHQLVPALYDKGIKVIDLSADFRIKDATLWEHWYGQPHGCESLLPEAVYGLPEVNREAIKEAQLIACPGCYPTAIQLGLLPLLENDLVDSDNLIASAASGISGAGRQAKVDLLHAEISDSFKAYAVEGHRHLPEIEQELQAAQKNSKKSVKLTFVPHLLPIIRGIHVTLYANLEDLSVDLQALYEKRYASEPFVDVMPQGFFPQTRSVRSSNMSRLAVARPQGRNTVVVTSVIDNLTKGASGQAVQNMNIMCGFSEQEGLDHLALLP
ncbi:N-acetyl-gamma-glutamyl-phosphate reductase [Candidatus Endobugula sertula]|uniref:N-acetyl-gamma-glutamyl-phosphate reductase n=1 Tax=Candidatus Endobugula sertula TaxID=62101 RepID=A0A1D2QSW0_9GAMM|nr:N-acetyl-gamma-glutamyl-phosphate reductase [Candidatus Endobugula sertula]